MIFFLAMVYTPFFILLYRSLYRDFRLFPRQPGRAWEKRRGQQKTGSLVYPMSAPHPSRPVTRWPAFPETTPPAMAPGTSLLSAMVPAKPS